MRGTSAWRSGLWWVTCLFVPVAGWGDDETLQASPPPIKVALYAGEGAGETVEHVVRALVTDKRIAVTELGPDEVRAGRLAEFDVLIQPGGSGSGQAKALGEDGRAKIRSFVKDGGGYVGVCAGSYLATCD